MASTKNVTNGTVDSLTVPTGLLLARSSKLVKQPTEPGWPYVSLPGVSKGNLTIRATARPQQLAILHNMNASVASSAITSVAEASDTSAGQLVNRLELRVPQSLVGSTLYVSVAGFGASVITPNSEVIVNGTTIQATPAYGVTLGAVIPGDLATSNMTIDVVWSDSGLVTMENYVALGAFFCGLGVTALSMVTAFFVALNKKRRVSSCEPIRGFLRRLRLHRANEKADDDSRTDASER
jgi:hypothetical protein